MGKETEYKLEVGDLQLLDCILCSEPVASRMQAPFIYIRMQTTYYDTEDGLLEKNRWMLRLRTENERSVVTMKTPGEGHTRGEWEVESEYLDEALPALAKLGAPEAIGRLDAEALLPVLVPLFISAFRRADELAMAMECRCYRGGDGRTRLKVLRCEKQDYIDLAVCIACFAVILASRLVFPNF